METASKAIQEAKNRFSVLTPPYNIWCANTERESFVQLQFQCMHYIVLQHTLIDEMVAVLLVPKNYGWLFEVKNNSHVLQFRYISAKNPNSYSLMKGYLLFCHMHACLGS